MILSKIKKCYLILQRRLNQSKELRNIFKYDNETLKKIVDSYLIVRNSKFTSEDLDNFKKSENYREQLLNDETSISFDVFGSDKTLLVREICKKAASGKKWCQLLYVISKQIETPIFLEIGTNVGISGSYILEALKSKQESKFISMEGIPQLCDISKKQFSTIVPTDKFKVIEGLYDITFPMLLKENIMFNVLFIDGNHQKNATIEYFNQLKFKITSPAVFIFDDINWGKGMKEAWKIIKNDEDVNYSIDLYKHGIVIIDKNDSNKLKDFKLFLTR